MDQKVQEAKKDIPAKKGSGTNNAGKTGNKPIDKVAQQNTQQSQAQNQKNVENTQAQVQQDKANLDAQAQKEAVVQVAKNAANENDKDPGKNPAFQGHGQGLINSGAGWEKNSSAKTENKPVQVADASQAIKSPNGQDPAANIAKAETSGKTENVAKSDAPQKNTKDAEIPKERQEKIDNFLNNLMANPHLGQTETLLDALNGKTDLGAMQPHEQAYAINSSANFFGGDKSIYTGKNYEQTMALTERKLGKLEDIKKNPDLTKQFVDAYTDKVQDFYKQQPGATPTYIGRAAATAFALDPERTLNILKGQEDRLGSTLGYWPEASKAFQNQLEKMPNSEARNKLRDEVIKSSPEARAARFWNHVAGAPGRIASTAVEGFAEGYGDTSIGRTAEERQSLREAEVYNNYDRKWSTADYVQAPFKAFNEYADRGLEVAKDIAMIPLRAVNGTVYSAGRSAAQVLEEAGIAENNPENDFIGMWQSLGGRGTPNFSSASRLASSAKSLGNVAEDASIAAVNGAKNAITKKLYPNSLKEGVKTEFRDQADGGAGDIIKNKLDDVSDPGRQVGKKHADEIIENRSETHNAFSNLGSDPLTHNALNFEDFPTGSAFSGVYDVKTSRFLAYPSGETILKNGEVPKNIAPRRGGHRIVNQELDNLLGSSSSDRLGFTMHLDEAGQIGVSWLSRSVNRPNTAFSGDFVPLELRQKIIDSITQATGKTVYSLD